jgi:hypothetical protein
MFGEPKRIFPIFQRLPENDVCEFESSQPSHGVGSLRAGIRALFPRPGVALWSQRVLVSSCEPRREATGPAIDDLGATPGVVGWRVQDGVSQWMIRSVDRA